MMDKTFDPADIETRFYPEMEQSGAFQPCPSSDKTPFTVMMPPPNVTGSLHMGHALNMTLQDILTRYNRMCGRDALWQPGTDHAGIATQMVVERQLEAKGEDRRKLGRDEFLKRVWDWKAQSGGTIIGQLKRLGSTPDWSRERFTMDEGLSKAVTKVFVQLYKEGLIYKDKRLVNWDPKLQTSISDLEVEHKEIKGKLYHVQYPLEQGGTISIATTRPETILADGAIAVHPDDEKYKDLVGQCAVVPICNRIIPIIADEYVQSEFGSGAVKITAAHDYNDFEVYLRHKDKTEIPLINLMNPDGTMNENCPDDYIGLDRFEARKKIIKDLDELDYLEKVEPHKHQVPYGDRSGVVVEPYLTDQWYCDAPTLAKPAIKAVEEGKTVFHPKNWENTYFEWMRNIRPWCISRQLWWGHQIPAWYGPDGHIFVHEDEDEAYALAERHYEERVELTRDPDVLDTWFSSALWPFSTLGWPDTDQEEVRRALEKYYPGDVLITGFDIIPFWVARMMMMGLHFMDDVPFKDVYIHALVRDEKGQKMSKSKGNVIDPLDLIEKYGADALRFTLTAMAAQGRDIKLVESRVQGYRNFATKLWNASRYCQMNNCAAGEGFNPSTVTYAPNQWIISSLIDTQKQIDKALADYRFNDAAGALYQFIWGTFCDWYLEFTKPLLEKDGDISKEVRQTTGWVIQQSLVLLNPFMPFITEELNRSFNGHDAPLLLQAQWPDYSGIQVNDDAKDAMTWLTRLIGEIRSVRADMNVPPKADIVLMMKDASEGTKANIEKFNEIICRMARLSGVEYVDAAPKGALQTVLDEATLILPVADIIDLEAESARLKKQISKLDQDIQKILQKLDNKKFIENAPEEIIDEQKERLSEAETTKAKFAAALEQLEAA